MKLILLFMAGSVAITMAAPSNEPSSADNISNVSYSSPLRKLNTNPSPSIHTSSVLTTVEKRQAQPAPPPLKVTLTIGTEKQHIGAVESTKTQAIWDTIHGCLKDTCTADSTSCTDTPCQMEKIMYKTAEGTEEHDALVSYWVDTYDILDKAHTNNMTRLIAGVFKSSTDVEANCYEVLIKDDKEPTRFCNVPNFVHVEWETGDSAEKFGASSMTVRFQYNRKTTGGQFDCFAIKSRMRDFFTKEHVENAPTPGVKGSLKIICDDPLWRHVGTGYSRFEL